MHSRHETNNCAQCFRHLDLLLCPRILREHNIDFDVRCAGPGEMILTEPDQYHAVVNRTICEAISIDFTLPSDDLGINGLAVCASCALSAQGLELVKADDRAAAKKTSRNQQFIVSQKRMAKDCERPQRRGSRPDRSISTTVAALKLEEREALRRDEQCSIPFMGRNAGLQHSPPAKVSAQLKQSEGYPDLQRDSCYLFMHQSCPYRGRARKVRCPPASAIY